MAGWDTSKHDIFQLCFPGLSNAQFYAKEWSHNNQ